MNEKKLAEILVWGNDLKKRERQGWQELPERAARALRDYIAKHGQPPHLEILIDGDEVEVKEFEMEKQE